MKKNIKKWSYFAFLATFFVLSIEVSWAARQVDLAQQPVTFLRAYTHTMGLAGATNSSSLEKSKQTIDFNQTLHVRMKQKYLGYPVWGSEAIVHIPQGNPSLKTSHSLVAAAEKNHASMNGKVYEDLEVDLKNVPPEIFTADQVQKVLQYLLADYQQRVHEPVQPKSRVVNLVVYVDEQHRAHWAFYVSFYFDNGRTVPTKPSYIVDALTFKPYRTWNGIMSLMDVKGGGFGGNPKIGKMIYDGQATHLPQLDIQRDPDRKLCFLTNTDVSVVDFRTRQLVNFPCTQVDAQHGNIYWNANLDEINGGFSPSNDALFAGKSVKEMYAQWYDTTVLIKNGAPMQLQMVTHSLNYDPEGNPDPDNALWNQDEQKMYFGDGQDIFYPLTSVGIAGHEVSHGFTAQNSELMNYGEAGAINESFSDMAAQAAEMFATGKNSWQIAPEVTREKGLALRYMDEPTKDCIKNIRPDKKCSIANIKDYRFDLNIHHTSGIFNKAFFQLATSPDWDVKKAFRIMVKANRDYWTTDSSLEDGACGVLTAANDYGYSVNAVIDAFAKVGIDLKPCALNLKPRHA